MLRRSKYNISIKIAVFVLIACFGLYDLIQGLVGGNFHVSHIILWGATLLIYYRAAFFSDVSLDDAGEAVEIAVYFDTDGNLMEVVSGGPDSSPFLRDAAEIQYITIKRQDLPFFKEQVAKLEINNETA